METCNQLGGYNVQERICFQDMLSSWFEMGDDHINPTLPYELPTDLHFPDDSLFSSGMSDLFGTPPDVTNFLFDSQPELDTLSMLLDTPVDAHDHHEISTLHAVFPSDDVLQCAPVGSCLGNGLGAPPPAVIEPTSVGSTFSSSTVTTTSWLETQPSMDVTINVSSPAMGSEEEDEGEGHTDQICLATTPTTMNSKNLVSERNRRKRLSQQLLALRALVPNITKMDKRSVLVDALAYLRSIHEEIASIQEEIKRAAKNSIVHASLQNAANGAQHQGDVNALGRVKGEIVQIETEKMEERRFIVKMTCKGGAGVGGEVLHMIESMGLEITYIALEQVESQIYVTTVFIRARKHEKMTEEKLKECITSTALRSGLLLCRGPTLHNIRV